MLPFLSALAWLALVPAVPQDSGQDPEPRARTTVIQLESGAVLRTKARERDGSWEVWQGGEWKLLPPGSVTRATAERELLDQASTLGRAIKKDDHVGRVALADWMIAQGLYAEALGALDRVLAKEPDQSDALGLLARAELPLAIPAAPERAEDVAGYVGAAARGGPAAREVAVQRLSRAKELPGVRAALVERLLDHSIAVRTFATLALRRLYPGAQAQELLGRAILDPSEDVRAGAALALRDAENPALIVPALRAVGSKHPVVRQHAIEALGRMEYPEAVEPLFTHLVSLQSGGGSVGAPRSYMFVGRQFAYVQDFDVEVAQFSAIADPIINVLTEGVVLEAAVTGVHEYVVAAERAAVRRSLSALTGARPGDTTEAWKRWWTEHGDEWQAGATPQKAPTSPSGRGA